MPVACVLLMGVWAEHGLRPGRCQGGGQGKAKDMRVGREPIGMLGPLSILKGIRR